MSHILLPIAAHHLHLPPKYVWLQLPGGFLIENVGSGVPGPESPPVPLTWGAWTFALPQEKEITASFPSRGTSFPQNRAGKQDIVCGFMKKSSSSTFFFFYSRHFRFYLKFGYSEMESYFKRAKTRQAPENGEISSTVAFFFFFLVLVGFFFGSTALPQTPAASRPSQGTKTPFFTPIFPPADGLGVFPRDFPPSGASQLPRTRPQTHGGGEGRSLPPHRSLSPLPGLKGRSSIKHRLSRGIPTFKRSSASESSD